MKRLSLLAVGVVAFSFVSAPALALSARTFVSGEGSDAGACPVTTPCRTFAYALHTDCGDEAARSSFLVARATVLSRSTNLLASLNTR